MQSFRKASIPRTTKGGKGLRPVNPRRAEQALRTLGPLSDRGKGRDHTGSSDRRRSKTGMISKTSSKSGLRHRAQRVGGHGVLCKLEPVTCRGITCRHSYPGPTTCRRRRGSSPVRAATFASSTGGNAGLTRQARTVCTPQGSPVRTPRDERPEPLTFPLAEKHCVSVDFTSERERCPLFPCKAYCESHHDAVGCTGPACSIPARAPPNLRSRLLDAHHVAASTSTATRSSNVTKRARSESPARL